VKAAIQTQAGGPEVLRIEELADPIPKDTEVLIRVEAISLEGGDLLARRHGRSVPPEALGYAAAGEIIQVGKAVNGFSVGQKVTTFNFNGSHAELRAVPAEHAFLVPEGLDMSVAAAIPCGPGTAAWTLDLGSLQSGQTVLVLGATGGVGNAAVQLAAKAGARVLGTGTNPDTLEKLKAYGLTHPLVTKDRPASERVRAVLGEEKVDLVIDNIGGHALVDALDVLKDGGRLVIVGVFGGFNQPIDAGHLLTHRQTVIGCFLGPVIGTPEVRAHVTDLLRLARQGEFEVPIDAVFPFAQIAAAHARAEERGRLGRVIVTV
jgi:NADPH:quinone reductase-like Zn-dependent oxidoreductase